MNIFMLLKHAFFTSSHKATAQPAVSLVSGKIDSALDHSVKPRCMSSGHTGLAFMLR